MTANLKECVGCTLVRRMYQNYKIINKEEHKMCSCCKQYFTLDKFYSQVVTRGDKTSLFTDLNVRNVYWNMIKKEKKLNELRYEVKNKCICITPCPYFIDVMIGSFRCVACTRNHGRDSENKVVVCSCGIEYNHKYAIKKQKIYTEVLLA